MPKNQKNWLIGAVVAVVVIAAGWYFWSNRVDVTTYAKTTTIEGNYSVTAKQRTVLEKGAALVVNGDLVLERGEIECKDGPLQIKVTGNLTVKDGTLRCSGESGDIAIVAMGSISIDKDSEISAGSTVQIVAKESELATTVPALERLYANAATPDGKIRLGPLTDPQGMALLTPASDGPLFAQNDSPADVVRVSKYGIPVAEAQVEAVINIAGRIVVATPAKENKRPLVVFNFPGVDGVNIQNLDLQGPDGRAGESDINKSCNANGKDGENAFRFLARAGSLRVGDFTLTLGNGGQGGDAETQADCYPRGTAKAGKGGKSGNFKMVAEKNFEITGTFTINAGRGGDGGTAIAHGKTGGPSEKGGDATATGGIGADNIKRLGLNGTVNGLANVQVGPVLGGNGGEARANPGAGGPGDGCGKKGGDGGKGTATGGRGGNAKVTLLGGAVRTAGAQDTGGAGGNATAFGAVGGNGGSCDPTGPGGNGGKGGDAKATFGRAGTGTPNGADGTKVNEQGGNGGNGGDGCKAGKGGKAGNGDPKGTDGTDGKDNCVVPPQGGGAGVVPGGGGTGTNGTKDIEVIKYNGKYIPVSQLMIEEHSGCNDAAHWHSKPYSGGPVKATDGSTIKDPGPECGFGKVSDVPAMKLQVKLDFRIQ